MAQHQIVFLFLAAGTSSRMRGSDKLLKEIDGVPLIQRILGEALKLNFPEFGRAPFLHIPACSKRQEAPLQRSGSLLMHASVPGRGKGATSAHPHFLVLTRLAHAESLGP